MMEHQPARRGATGNTGGGHGVTALPEA